MHALSNHTLITCHSTSTAHRSHNPPHHLHLFFGGTVRYCWGPASALLTPTLIIEKEGVSPCPKRTRQWCVVSSRPSTLATFRFTTSWSRSTSFITNLWLASAAGCRAPRTSRTPIAPPSPTRSSPSTSRSLRATQSLRAGRQLA